MSDFEADMIFELENIFEPGSIETLAFIAEQNSTLSDCAVKIIHEPSGVEVICDKYQSQRKNKATALVELIKKLKSG